AKKSKDEVIKYWSEKTKLPKNKFSFVSTQKRTKEFGICHIYISDVLLRRVLDLIMNKISE
ncbi:hypothetical protein JW711_03345, partial [Candidatus Woesearchaeota archaeon]|nr:hypothetical protein [Candidatus Woesearchaeota archaeon]